MKLGGNNIEVYDSIETMPITRYTKFNKYLLIDAGIGSNINDLDMHLDKIARYGVMGKRKEMTQEILNLRLSYSNIIQELSPKYMAFAVLVKSINGKPCNDISEDGIIATLDKLKHIEHNKIDSLVDSVQKKNR